MLVGLVFLAVLTSIPLGSGISALWMTVYNDKQDPSCNVWFYLFTTVTLALGSVVWYIVGRWYKNREMDQPDRGRLFVENYYDYYCTLGSP